MDVVTEEVTPLDFWFEHLGKHLGAETPEASLKVAVETRLKKGVGFNALGAGIDAHYIVTSGHAWLIGKIERPNTSKVTYVPSDSPGSLGGQGVIAQWLLSESARFPVMLGVIGKASPMNSLALSYTPSRVHYGEAGAGMTFNLDVVRRAVVDIGKLSWWKVVLPALRQKESMETAILTNAATHVVDRERKKMRLQLEKTPELRALLPRLAVKIGSGEQQVLNWVYRAE